jgi:cysteinyl-tRNA synthetase
MVTVDGQKMGKSLNNFITLKQAFPGPDEKNERLTRKYDPLAVRQLILNSHYRSPLDFSDAALTAAQSGYDRITKAVVAIRKKKGSTGQGDIDSAVVDRLGQLREKFETAMNDDLNTSVALSVVFELVKLANELLPQNNVTAQTLEVVDELFSRLGGDVLGVVQDEYQQAGNSDEKVVDGLVGILIEQRSAARGRKDFATSDAIRDKLDEIGIVLEDKPGATTWRTK